jgi:hypothetical protein
MLLYHGTGESRLDTIRKEGIKPRGDQPGHWEHTVESNSQCVYLTDIYAGYYAYNAAREENERWAIIEIDSKRLNQKLFRPDEDFVAQYLHRFGDEFYKKLKLVDLTEIIRDDIDVYKDAWSDSIRGLGTVCYKGIIPVRAITRISIYNPKSNFEMTITAGDPTITLMNHYLMEKKYQLVTRWLMGEHIDAKEYMENGLFLPEDMGGPTVEDIQKSLDNQEVRLIGFESLTRV